VHRDVLITLYKSDDQIKNNEMGGACRTYGDEYRVLVGRPEEKILL
jgi:hypothetical protein